MDGLLLWALVKVEGILISMVNAQEILISRADEEEILISMADEEENHFSRVDAEENLISSKVEQSFRAIGAASPCLKVCSQLVSGLSFLAP